jgi:hypothetical protein
MSSVLEGKSAALVLKRKVLHMNSGAIMYTCIPIKEGYKGSGGITRTAADHGLLLNVIP